LNIYIYGGKSFKKHMKSILHEANLNDNLHEINDVSILEKTILEDKLSIYLIDSDKIISKNIIIDKLNFLKPKDAIDKKILQDAGIDDMCFNSDDALIEYIKNKIENSDISSTDEIVENNEILIEKEERNMADITQIDEIFEDDLLSALDTELSEPSNSIDTNIDNEIKSDKIEAQDTNELQINSDNIDDVTALIKELLNNKTLELSIKIKAS